jgi:hypothetical protein
MPCVIDFGLSTRPKADEKDTYREKVIESGHFKEIMLQWDSVNIDQLKRQVKKYLHERNQGVL